MAVERLTTPTQPTGPFYPLELPLDDDNDLVLVKGQADLAKGQITNVVGRITDERGRPVTAARVEIWQVNAFGRYHHPHDRQDKPFDPGFQGHGQTVTNSSGDYRFRTIKPVPYPGRAPHIHFAISGQNFEPLITQMYLAGAPENEGDFLLNRIRDPRQQQRLMVDLKRNANKEGNESVGRFDIVLAADGRFDP